MTFSRRSALYGLGSIVATPAILRAQDMGDALATCAQGKLRGVRSPGLSTFKAIPYAGSVSGQARFKAPPAPASWTGVRDASQLGPPSIQPPKGTSGIFEPACAEDCLVLNIWTPAADGKRRPVMFYNHGGGYVTGSGGGRGADGGRLATEYDVVVVETNHRLGLLGYLYLGELLGPEYQANQGMLDILAALKWVKVNIEAFGGDPNNVMIRGESGGAGKTACLYGMPLADPYFNKAAMESGGPTQMPRAAAVALAERIIKYLGLTRADAKKILDLPVEQLLDAQMKNGGGFGAFVDGEIVPEVLFQDRAPAISARKPMIVGTCQNEAVFFSYTDPTAFNMDEAEMKKRLQPMTGKDTEAWIATYRKARPSDNPTDLFFGIETARMMRVGAVNMAEKKAQQAAAPVYSYIVTYQNQSLVPKTNHPFQASHASDIRLTFDIPDITDPPAGQERPEIFGGDRSEPHRQTAHHMSRYWANFARTGVPSCEGQPAWTPYSMARRETLLIDAQCKLVQDPESAERKFWESLNR